MQSQLRVRATRAVLQQRRLFATPSGNGIPPVPPSGALPVRPVVVTSGTPVRPVVVAPVTPGSSTIADASSEIPPPPPPPPKQPRRFFRRFLLYTTLGLITFYPLSGLISTRSEAYREFFTSTFPLGETVADYADDHAWGKLGMGKPVPVDHERPVQRKADLGRTLEAKGAEAKNEAGRVLNKAEAGAKNVEDRAKAAADKAKVEAKAAADKAKAGAKDVANRAEAAGHDAKLQAKSALGKAQSEATDLKDRLVHASQDATSKAESLAHDAKVQAKSAADRAQAEATSLKDRVVHATQDAADKAKALVKDTSIPFNAGDGIEGIVREAENALSRGEAKVADVLHRGEHRLAGAARKVEDKASDALDKVDSKLPTPSVYPDTQRPRELRPETVTPAKPSYEGQSKYTGQLPLGHEPPPGYYVPPPPKPAAEPAAPTLPLLAPKVKDFGTDEPIISQLASTIDSLTSSLSTGSGTVDILSKAQDDLTNLSKRLTDIKKAEKEKLEKSLDAKTKEFESTLKIVEASKAQAEAGIKEKWEKERATMVSDWKKEMDVELESQREGIEKRLREEVISQGIELQRRWLRSIKTQVETERGGRLAKLDNLTSSLKELEQITLDNSATLDQNVRLHKVWSALRAVQAKTEAGDVSFDTELRVLKSLSSDKVGSSVLDQLEKSGIAQTGVKSLAALSSWFTNSVSPRVQSASLVPAPESAGVASHLASLTLSKVMFRPTPGPVDGSDVSAILARAEWCLGEKDLDGAAREVNRLSGWPKRLASDWLREARRALEVRQALDVVATDATLGSLLLV